MVPKIDMFKCDGCGACAKRCPPQVIGLVKDKAVILADLCEECGICLESCPIEAIHFRIPNYGVQHTHESYRTVRQFTPHPGNWRVGVPLGRDGKGHP